MRSERRRQSVFETNFERHTPSRPSKPGVHERKVQIYIDWEFYGEAEYDIHGDEDPQRLEESSVPCRLYTYSIQSGVSTSTFFFVTSASSWQT